MLTSQARVSFSNEPYVGTLENEGVGLAEIRNAEVPAELQAKIDEYKAAIIDGSLKIETPNAP